MMAKRDRSPEAVAEAFIARHFAGWGLRRGGRPELEAALVRLIRRIREQDARLCERLLRDNQTTGWWVREHTVSVETCAAAIRAQNRRSPERR